MNQVISIDDLLQDVSPDAPCGLDLEYDPEFVAMEQAARGREEQQFGDSVLEAEGPDWRAVKKQALALFTRTHDLRVAVYLARALTVTDGLVGHRDGLCLVRELIARRWDQMHPLLDPDDDDPLMRTNTLLNLCGPDTLLGELREVELVQARGLGRFTFRDYQVADGKLPPAEHGEAPSLGDIEAAFLACEPEDLQAKTAAVMEAIAATQAIDEDVTTRVGVGNAVSLTPLVDQLRELNSILSEALARRGEDTAGGGAAGAAAGADAASAAAGAPAAGNSPASASSGEINSREDVIRILDRACQYYERHEPASPVPLLLRRAKGLVHKDFLEIMRDLAPGGVQDVEKIKGPDAG